MWLLIPAWDTCFWQKSPHISITLQTAIRFALFRDPFQERFFHGNSNSMEFFSALIDVLVKWSLWNFAHGMTAMLSWHVQDFFLWYDTLHWSYTKAILFYKIWITMEKSLVKLASGAKLSAVIILSCLFQTLPWHHNERDGVSNHQCLGCLHNCLFRHRSIKTSKLHITGLCQGNPLVTSGYPSQRASNPWKCFRLMTSSWLTRLFDSTTRTTSGWSCVPFGPLNRLKMEYCMASYDAPSAPTPSFISCHALEPLVLWSSASYDVALCLLWPYKDSFNKPLMGSQSRSHENVCC